MAMGMQAASKELYPCRAEADVEGLSQVAVVLPTVCEDAAETEAVEAMAAIEEEGEASNEVAVVEATEVEETEEAAFLAEVPF